MKTETITIATETGTRETIGRATPVPGLAITGARGSYAITHVPSGYLVCRASVANTQATLEHIRNAMMLATMADMVLGSVIDWTAPGDELDNDACVDWLRAFFSHLRLGL